MAPDSINGSQGHGKEFTLVLWHAILVPLHWLTILLLLISALSFMRCTMIFKQFRPHPHCPWRIISPNCTAPLLDECVKIIMQMTHTSLKPFRIQVHLPLIHGNPVIHQPPTPAHEGDSITIPQLQLHVPSPEGATAYPLQVPLLERIRPT